MNNPMATWFPRRIAAMALLALLFSGCTADPPEPTRTPDPTVPAMEPRAPAGPGCPGPGRPDGGLAGTHSYRPPGSRRARGPPHSGGTGRPRDGESELLAVLASLPLEFRERGIWFSNFKQSLEVTGTSKPADLEELESWPADQQEKYARNSGGPVSNLAVTMRQTRPHWEGAYGFSFFEIDAITVTGMDNFMPFETNYLTGEFDEEKVVRSLTELGYRTEPAGDDVYYAIRNDREQDPSPRNPATRSAFGYANRIFVGDNLLVVSPDTQPVVQVIRARNGVVPSVADSPAFFGIAAELSDPLAAALLTREATLDPDTGGSLEQIPGGWERPEGWEVMHGWTAFGAGFSRTPDTAALRFSLYYPHRDWAERDAETLVERIGSYMAWLERDSPRDQFCKSWSPAARVYGTGSTLTVTCEMPSGDESVHLQSGVTSLVPGRFLGFLDP